MRSVVELARRLYRGVVPVRIRESRLARRLRPHDLVYDSTYYDDMLEGRARRSAPAMAATIVETLAPKSVIDVGCGTGALLEAIRDHGCRVFGLEYSRAALGYCRARRLPVRRFDITRHTLETHDSYDVAVSMEVAEHLPENAADRDVDLLTRLAPTVVFTAATPGQGGKSHQNEQPHSYWIEKFAGRGYDHDREASNTWRAEWETQGDVQNWYYRNVMLFRRSV